ncbi:MAG: heme transporter CcmC [Nitrosopumilaceae archaeon]
MKSIIMLMVVSLFALVIFPMINFADAATEGKEYVKLRNEVWNLFFRMTTAAFVVGAVVSGTLIWLVWRFRESHPKNKNPTKWETGEEVH